jgi:hypothetical protein
VIVLAVDVYRPRALVSPFTATVYEPPFPNVIAHFPSSWAGLLIVVAYVPDRPPAARADAVIASAAPTARSMRYELRIDFLLRLTCTEARRTTLAPHRRQYRRSLGAGTEIA